MKSGTAAFVALALAAFAVPRPAAADWEYTRWGMTAEQVIAASRGAASIVPIDSRYRNEDEEYEITVEAVTSGPPVLNIGFMFDIPGGGLKCVVYNASGFDADAVRAMLVQRYGKPIKESSFTFGRSQARTLSWKTPDAIEIVLNDKPVAAVVSHCAPGRG
jgi:hypothetical protein